MNRPSFGTAFGFADWLDLGWLRRNEDWEFHPWGPLSRGYLIGATAVPKVRARMRMIRGAMLALALVGVLPLVLLRVWWPLVAVGLIGGSIEAWLTWVVVRPYMRTALPLGLENGLLYLARWVGPKLLLLARMATMLLVAFAVFLLWHNPLEKSSYLLLVTFVAMQYVLNYLEQVNASHS